MIDVVELPSFGQTIRMAMRLEPSIYRAIVAAPNGLHVALLIVALASVSEALGQSVVLFLNNIRPRRFALSIGISAISNMVGYLLWVGVIWLVLHFVYDINVSTVAIASAVGLAYAPQLLAFFELLPYWGNPFSIILSLWSMLAITVAIDANMGLDIRQAALASAIGWLLIQLWRRTLGVPIYALGDWLQRRAAGTPLKFNIRDIPNLRRDFYITENIENWRDMLSRAKWEELRETMLTEGINFNFSRRAGGKSAERASGQAEENDRAEENAQSNAPLTPPSEKSDHV